jgi:hypothetical protein
MDVLALLNQKVFLGQEFLTWLWYLSEEEGGLEVEGLGFVDLTLGERLVLGPAMGAEGARITVSGREASLAEAREGLRRGKLVESLRLGLEIGGDEYWLTLGAAELNVSGLAMPTVAPQEAGQEGPEGLILERVALIDSAYKALEGFLAHFLTLRLDPEAEPELRAAMAGWTREASRN